MAIPEANSLVISSTGPTGEPCLGLVANRAYRIQHSARAIPLDDVVPVPPGLAYAPSTNGGARPRMVSDEATFEPHKPLTDVLLTGSAHATGGPVTHLDTGLEVGAARKAVRAIGARRITLGARGRVAFTTPEPFGSMPLTWDHAYGGRDAHAEKLIFGERKRALGASHALDLTPFDHVFYVRNGSGRGYFIDVDRERLEGAALPNLEDPTDPVTPERIVSERVTQWIDCPVAACYEPTDILTFPRSAFFLKPVYDTPERTVHELSTGAVLAEDLARRPSLRGPRNPRVYNAAPSGLAVCRLRGGERVRLWNLHRKRAFLEFDLPDDEPRLSLDVPGVGERKLAPVLTTVRIEPDADRVVLTWAAAFRVLVVYPDEMTRAMPRTVIWRRSPTMESVR
jgi:hypothetical protein